MVLLTFIAYIFAENYLQSLYSHILPSNHLLQPRFELSVVCARLYSLGRFSAMTEFSVLKTTFVSEPT